MLPIAFLFTLSLPLPYFHHWCHFSVLLDHVRYNQLLLTTFRTINSFFINLIFPCYIYSRFSSRSVIKVNDSTVMTRLKACKIRFSQHSNQSECLPRIGFDYHPLQVAVITDWVRTYSLPRSSKWRNCSILLIKIKITENVCYVAIRQKIPSSMAISVYAFQTQGPRSMVHTIIS